MTAAALALIVANSPLAPIYFETLHAKLGPLSVEYWINDALMALFFLLVGLEIKREFLEGELATPAARVLPGLAALGGMVGPALIYVAFNLQHPETIRGWAIPAATDIAFALGVLSLLGSRVPVSLKIFLTALAIMDDLGAVLIIALFYTADLDLPSLGSAAAVVAVLFALNRFRVTALAPYLLAGLLLWVFVFQSGVHATVAGVLLAMAIPLKGKPTPEGEAVSPLHTVEHALNPWVAYAIVPIFGFANAGVALGGMALSNVVDPVPLGVAAGLFFGKQIGVFGTAWVAINLGWARLPASATWRQMYGVSILCGIGFTMSLFIGLLAFEDELLLQNETKIGVLIGSGISAVIGWIVLATAPQRKPPEA